MATLTEKRKYRRFPCNLHIHIPLRGRILKARMNDISEAGAMFASSESFRPMMEYEVALLLQREQAPIVSRAVVVWSKKDKSKKLYSTGLFFSGLLPKARLKLSKIVMAKRA